MANYSDNSKLYDSIQDLSNKSDEYKSVLKLIWNKLNSINTNGNQAIQNQINQIQGTLATINQSHPSKMHVFNGGSTDLNALTEQGVYSFTGTTLKNAPSNTIGNQFTGYMTVDSSTGNPNDGTPDRVQMLVLDFSAVGNAYYIYLRHWSGGSWFSWTKLADDNEISNLQNQLNNKPNWSDEAWTRNQVVNGAAANVLNQANSNSEKNRSNLQNQITTMQKMFNQNGQFKPLAQNLSSVVNQPILGTWIVATISCTPGQTNWISYLQGGSLIINNSASYPNLTLYKHVGDLRVYKFVPNVHSYTIGWNGSDAGGTCAQNICVTQSANYIPFNFTSNDVVGQTNYLLNEINNNKQLTHKGEIPSTDMNSITTDGIYDIKGEWLNNGPGDARDGGNYYGTLKVVHDDYGQLWQFMYTDWGDPADQNSSGVDGDGGIAYRCMNQGWNVIVTQAQVNQLQNQINNINGQLHFSHEIGPESGDFNNFTQTGYYAIWDGGTQNSPIQHNGSLLVFNQPNTETLLQIFFDGSDNRAWMRQRGLLGDNTDWNAWRELGTNAIQPLPSWASDLNNLPDGTWYLPDDDINDKNTIISQQTYHNGQNKFQSIIYSNSGKKLVRSFNNNYWTNWQAV